MNGEVDNSPNRLIRVFFYGLCLDPDVLRGKVLSHVARGLVW